MIIIFVALVLLLIFIANMQESSIDPFSGRTSAAPVELEQYLPAEERIPTH